MKELSVKYALFDMDGTLADTMGYWRNLAADALAARGVTLAEEHIRAIETMPFSKGVAYLKEQNVPEIENVTREEILSVLEEHYRRDAKLKSGVREYLDFLRASGAKMAVATLTPRAQALVCLESLGIADYFEFVFTGEDYPKGKSSPEIFFDAAKRFGCEATEMHLFEDSFYSMQTAHAVGIPVVAVEDAWQCSIKQDILAIADAYFEDGLTRRIK